MDAKEVTNINLWVIGDAFVQSWTQTFYQSKNELFIPKYFKTRVTTDQNRGRSNAIGRMLNSIANTFNIYRSIIPKWIVIVPENDLINCIQYTEFGISGAYGTIIEYMMKQINQMINTFFITDLPLKANRYNLPYVLWVEPTLHLSYTNNSL